MIPGKVVLDPFKQSQVCTYIYLNAECATTNFKIIKSQHFGRHADNYPQAPRTEEFPAYWCAVANTEWGRIPGMARQTLCTFTYEG